MEVTHHKLKIERTAHYYSLGTLCAETKKVWMVIHGYGQHADRIIQKFNHLDLNDTFVFAPEGLNKFYWHEGKREPVATWMTSRHRLDEIEDYKAWIDACYRDVMDRLDMAKIDFNVLSFSQGTATAWRWLLHRKPNISKLLQWAGDNPPELDYRGEQEYIKSIDTYFVYGDQDKFLTEERKKQFFDFFEQCQIQYKMIEFEGKHLIDRKVLAQLVSG